ncbi:helix-turn-helix domain-containing protein [Microbacterium sp. LMI1-1-1.1]|uniref:helix-turn-helix domain-containing protein n=1 Tax=Microbacterium sp. LMI1-1-1.1 TaxID=3135223 RepID=UPI0034666941
MRTGATGVAQSDARLDEVIRDLAVGVHAHRLQRGMTTAGLAAEAGLSESTVRAVESGRVSASLASLVALADALGVGVGALFGDAGVVPEEGVDDPAMRSVHVVPSEVVWGGELPPAPWLAAAGAPDSDVTPAPVASVPPVPVAPTPVGPAPAATPEPVAPAAAAAALPDAVVPAPAAAEARPAAPRTEQTWGNGIPPAPWVAEHAPDEESLPQDYPVRAATDAAGPAPDTSFNRYVVTAAASAQTVVPRVHHLSAARGMQETSAYVFVSPDAAEAAVVEPAPRTFADLRKGKLAGRTFPSLQEFAVAAVVEAGHPVPPIARMFRVPVWRLEQWVAEARSPAEGPRADRP